MLMDVIVVFAIQGLSMDIQQEEPQYGTVLQWPTEFNMTFFDLVTLLDHSTDTYRYPVPRTTSQFWGYRLGIL